MNRSRTPAAIAALIVVAMLVAPAWARPAAQPARAEPPRALLRMEAGGGGATPRALYVGQTVPVTIRAYFLDGTGVSLNGQPRLVSDALTLSDLSDKPAQISTQLHGLPYTALTWTGNLTAARAGDTRSDVELPVELTYREAAAAPVWSRSPGAGDDDDADDPFASILKNTPFASDPFFSQMFKGGDPFAGMMRDLAGTVRQRAVTLRAPGTPTHVMDLPAPQPAGFTGAVGRFEIAASVSPGPYHVGEPITLRLVASGQGSFARLSLSGVPSTAELTGYTTTVAGGPAGDHQKVFTQTLVPRRTGAVTVPPVTLTYFDARARRYVERTTRPLRLDVLAGAPESNTVATSPSVQSSAPSAAAAPERGAPGLAPLSDAIHDTLTPVIDRAAFRVALGALLALAVALALAGRFARNGVLARRRLAWRLRRELASQQRALREAARRGDADALFAGARRALQARLAATWGVAPEAIAAADVTRHLGEDGAAIREIFDQADRHAYAGARPHDELDLEKWPERVSAELRALESRT